MLATPTANAIMDAGSGTGAFVMRFESNVTAPFRANALPWSMIAPVVSVMLVNARM